MDKTNKDISSQRNVDGLIFIKTLQLGCALLLIMLLMLILLWNCLVQLTTFRPGTITLFSTDFNYANYSLHFPQQSNGYLMVSSNGGLNQMRAGICDMVAIASYMNFTLIVPELDHKSLWHDKSKFEDIFDVDYFIDSLRDEVQILKQIPPDKRKPFSMIPRSWASISYYYDRVLSKARVYNVLRLTRTDARLANNGLPKQVQKLRCKVMYNSLRFTPQIEELGKKIVNILRQKGPFLALHLRYESDILAFTGCTQGCTPQQVQNLTAIRYACPWWREKEIDSESKRKEGLCPLTPEETMLVLRALGIDLNTQIYLAAGDIFDGENRMSDLRTAYPNLVKKEWLLSGSELEPFRNHSNQMAALDYIVSLESDVFVPTYEGHMAQVVEGHRRYLGYKVTMDLNRLVVVSLIDRYRNGNVSWEEFSELFKGAHVNRKGGPSKRVKIPNKPKVEDYFYSNPEECLPSMNKHV